MEAGSAYHGTEGEVTYRLKAPKRLNQYVLGYTLGKGSYGKVREAYDLKEERVVAIKIMRKKLVRKLPGGLEGVEREIEIMRGLDHDLIVGYVEHFSNEENGKLYIVSEYVGAGTLQDFIQRTGPCSEAVAKRFFFDICTAVHHCHSLGIVHRDLKPGNFLVTLGGRMKVSDFGTAENLSIRKDPSSGMHIQGSPAIQPPEVASGEVRSSGKAGDIWAMGIALYYMVTGKYPFEGNTVYTLFEQIQSGVYEMPSISESGQDLLQQLLALEREDRITIEGIKEHAWIEGCSNSSIPIQDQPFLSPSCDLDIVASESLFTEAFISELEPTHTPGIGGNGYALWCCMGGG